MFNINSYAKINLSLEILGKFSDGYHQIKSIMQTINICDSIEFLPSNEIKINIYGHDIPLENNLVYKAIVDLKKIYSIKQGIDIRINKNIPIASGFGGGSSNAANTILALNKIWGLNLTIEEMVGIAMKIGSDVPYFLYQGTALVEGMGEIVTPLDDVILPEILIITPNKKIIDNKTKKMFNYLTNKNHSTGYITDNIIEKINTKSIVSNIDIYNVFHDISFESYSFMKVLFSNLNRIGITDINICGAGPSVFTLIDNKEILNIITENKYFKKFKIFLVKSHKSSSVIEYDN